MTTLQERLDALLRSAGRLALLEDQAGLGVGHRPGLANALKARRALHQELYDDFVRDFAQRVAGECF